MVLTGCKDEAEVADAAKYLDQIRAESAKAPFCTDAVHEYSKRIKLPSRAAAEQTTPTAHKAV
jgi:hypothetical protein